MIRMLLLSSAFSVLTTTCALAHDYNPSGSARAAQSWREDAMSLAPRVAEASALDPQGPTLIASHPVPDTPMNRDRFGRPISRSGRMTPPIGD
jgi:hypothetical protein